jgi:hypothetical protein
VADGAVRELLTDVLPREVGFTEDGARITYSTAVRTKTSYTRRDGTEYGVYALDLSSGETTELVEPSEERTQVTWNDQRDAYAYTKDGAVLVRGLDDAEARDVSEGLRTLPGDTTETDFSIDRWSPDGDRLLLTSQAGWHLLDVAAGRCALCWRSKRTRICVRAGASSAGATTAASSTLRTRPRTVGSED